ncbi:hypothetical protein CEUSTIGMA_g428.t1 [Chlamydomonas eustigma]|uniref:Exonuclease 1 n=1 Tax=Chlamydomonas eustigma TaxID=1157962 RepID=A0A250WQ51_9CHLO|nr:hypothetical protein CEUSTIGMA_g428.t1 [Chlamydomonas eustigma]|eukprot:GAX72975.1 hypothetical protein CEUSTIGMA_g428.t1 [Chlamydomonas eustigma]
MGINGLLPVLKSIAKSKHIREYHGQHVAIDGFSWLHKGAYCCSRDLCTGVFTDKFVRYCMSRVDMLIQNGVHPVVVFDGGRLPTKSQEEESRRSNRKENLDKALAHLASGNSAAAEEYFQRAVNVNGNMAKQWIEALRERNISFIVAPYEADAQMAYLALNGFVHAVITEDSDLLVYGCPRVMYKLDKHGNGEEVQYDSLIHNQGLSFVGFTEDMFMATCIMAGCDFLTSLPSIGFKKAHQHMKKYRDFVKVCKMLRFNGTAVPRDYEERFQRALWVFRHQRVYCPRARQVVHVRPLPPGGIAAMNVDVMSAIPEGEEEQSLEFLGPPIPALVAQGIAEGLLDSRTKEPFDLKIVYKGCSNLPRGVAQQLQQHYSGTVSAAPAGSCGSRGLEQSRSGVTGLMGGLEGRGSGSAVSGPGRMVADGGRISGGAVSGSSALMLCVASSARGDSGNSNGNRKVKEPLAEVTNHGSPPYSALLETFYHSGPAAAAFVPPKMNRREAGRYDSCQIEGHQQVSENTEEPVGGVSHQAGSSQPPRCNATPFNGKRKQLGLSVPRMKQQKLTLSQLCQPHPTPGAVLPTQRVAAQGGSTQWIQKGASITNRSKNNFFALKKPCSRDQAHPVGSIVLTEMTDLTAQVVGMSQEQKTEKDSLPPSSFVSFDQDLNDTVLDQALHLRDLDQRFPVSQDTSSVPDLDPPRPSSGLLRSLEGPDEESLLLMGTAIGRRPGRLSGGRPENVMRAIQSPSQSTWLGMRHSSTQGTVPGLGSPPLSSAGEPMRGSFDVVEGTPVLRPGMTERKLEVLAISDGCPQMALEVEGGPQMVEEPRTCSLSQSEATENGLDSILNPAPPCNEEPLLRREPQDMENAGSLLGLENDDFDVERTRALRTAAGTSTVRDMLVEMRKSLSPLLDADRDDAAGQKVVDVISNGVKRGLRSSDTGSGKAVASFGRRRTSGVVAVQTQPNVFSLFAAQRHGRRQVEDYHSFEGSLRPEEVENNFHRKMSWEAADLRCAEYAPIGQANSKSSPLAGERAEDCSEQPSTEESNDEDVLIVEDQFHSISHIRRYGKVAKEALKTLERKHKRHDAIEYSEKIISQSRLASTHREDSSRQATQCLLSEVGRPAAATGIFRSFSMGK